MQQMEMFKKGGLKDEGGTKDPVSGNDVPSGSLKEEVRDDIDAKLSPGEFVFPADVVRFIGLQKLMQMRDKAKAGLQRMEDMGQMGNSDEAIIDDDVPFGTTDLIIMAGPSDNEMNQGGMPTQQQQSNQAGGVPGQGRFNQLVGQPQFNYEVKKFRNEAGAELFIPFVGDNPVYQAPPGYTEVTQEQQQEELADPTLPQDKVKSELKKDRSSMDPDISTTSVSEMSPSQKADLGQFYSDNPIAGKVAETVGNFASANISRGFGAPVVSQAMGVFGAVSAAMDDATLSEIGKSMLGFGTKGQGTLDREAVETALYGRKNNTAAYQQAVKDYADKLSKSIDTNLAGYSNATVSAAKDTTFGASPAQMAAHAEGISRGERPEGSTANAVGGYSTIGTNTPFGYSTNKDGEVDYNQTQKDKQKQKEKELKDRQAAVEKQDKFSFSMSGEPGGEAIGGKDTPGQEAQAQDPAETGVSQNEQDDLGADPEIATGGFIPKKKKQKKKKKRGGLASR